MEEARYPSQPPSLLCLISDSTCSLSLLILPTYANLKACTKQHKSGAQMHLFKVKIEILVGKYWDPDSLRVSV